MRQFVVGYLGGVSEISEILRYFVYLQIKCQAERQTQPDKEAGFYVVKQDNVKCRRNPHINSESESLTMSSTSSMSFNSVLISATISSSC